VLGAGDDDDGEDTGDNGIGGDSSVGSLKTNGDGTFFFVGLEVIAGEDLPVLELVAGRVALPRVPRVAVVKVLNLPFAFPPSKRANASSNEGRST
jgi:hypothetical protein